MHPSIHPRMNEWMNERIITHKNTKLSVIQYLPVAVPYCWPRKNETFLPWLQTQRHLQLHPTILSEFWRCFHPGCSPTDSWLHVHGLATICHRWQLVDVYNCLVLVCLLLSEDLKLQYYRILQIQKNIGLLSFKVTLFMKRKHRPRTINFPILNFTINDIN